MAKPEPAPDWPAQFLFIGCGNMAGAMLSRWLDCGLPPERVTGVRPSGAPVAPGVTVRTALDAPVQPRTIVLLGFKPQQLPRVGPDLAPLIGEGVILLSILAGLPLARLRDAFPNSGPIIRCMPNLPVRIGKGVSILAAGPNVGEGVRAQATTL